jgi:hypothetical protein
MGVLRTRAADSPAYMYYMYSINVGDEALFLSWSFGI